MIVENQMEHFQPWQTALANRANKQVLKSIKQLIAGMEYWQHAKTSSIYKPAEHFRCSVLR